MAVVVFEPVADLEWCFGLLHFLGSASISVTEVALMWVAVVQNTDAVPAADHVILVYCG